MTRGPHGSVLEETINTIYLVWPVSQMPSELPKPTKKKAGSEPQGPSTELNKAGVLVMGRFLDQTARATAARKAIDRNSRPLASKKPGGQVFGTHHPKHSLKPHRERSN